MKNGIWKKWLSFVHILDLYCYNWSWGGLGWRVSEWWTTSLWHPRHVRMVHIQWKQWSVTIGYDRIPSTLRRNIRIMNSNQLHTDLPLLNRPFKPCNTHEAPWQFPTWVSIPSCSFSGVRKQITPSIASNLSIRVYEENLHPLLPSSRQLALLLRYKISAAPPIQFLLRFRQEEWSRKDGIPLYNFKMLVGTVDE